MGAEQDSGRSKPAIKDETSPPAPFPVRASPPAQRDYTSQVIDGRVSACPFCARTNKGADRERDRERETKESPEGVSGRSTVPVFLISSKSGFAALGPIFVHLRERNRERARDSLALGGSNEGGGGGGASRMVPPQMALKPQEAGFLVPKGRCSLAGKRRTRLRRLAGRQPAATENVISVRSNKII